MPDEILLGHFKLLQEIGRGGMGAVYRAFDPTLNREVAIKLLNPALASRPHFVGEFLQEARNAAAISHPHIVQVHLVDKQDNQYYIVMELLQGRSLADIVEAEGALAEERALELAIDVAEALKAAYQTNMIHGDIKPANIFVTEHGAKVLDFGLAKLANVEAPAEGVVWGSPYYISPERVGRKAEDFRSDIYSLGASLFYVLTGRPPFNAEDAIELAMKRLNEKPPLLRTVRADLTETTEQVVGKMLNKISIMRFRDYDHLLEKLREAKVAATAARLGISFKPFDPNAKPAPVAAPPPKRSMLPWIIAGSSVAALAIGAAAFFFFRDNKPEPTTPPPVTAPTSTVAQVTPPPAPPPVPVVVTQTVTIVKPPPPAPKPPPVNKAAAAEELARRVLAEKDRVKSAESVVGLFYKNYDFPGALASLTEVSKKLTTTDGRKAMQRPVLVATLLGELKTTLGADFTRLGYSGPRLKMKTGALLAGPPSRATETEIFCSTPFGEVASRWDELSPESVMAAAEFYCAMAVREPLAAQARRHLTLAAFANQFVFADARAVHANEAIRLDPSTEADVKTLFGGVPKLAPVVKPVAPTVPSPKPAPKPLPKSGFKK